MSSFVPITLTFLFVGILLGCKESVPDLYLFLVHVAGMNFILARVQHAADLSARRRTDRASLALVLHRTGEEPCWWSASLAWSLAGFCWW